MQSVVWSLFARIRAFCNRFCNKSVRDEIRRASVGACSVEIPLSCPALTYAGGLGKGSLPQYLQVTNADSTTRPHS